VQDVPVASAPAPPAPRAFPAEPERKQETDAAAGAAGSRERANTRALAKESAPAATAPKVMAAPAAGAATSRAENAFARDESRRREPADATALPSPEAWVAKIVALIDAGRRDDAARELNAFRNAYPDADSRLPPSLRDWAATVRREP